MRLSVNFWPETSGEPFPRVWYQSIEKDIFVKGRYF
jgi:hypothetical protein